MNENPYDAPKAGPDGQPEPVYERRGRVCRACGSRNTGRALLSRTRPNLFFVMVFGWIVLLIRGAFAMRTDLCRDCGATMRYKSAGSWVALAVLGFVVFCVVYTIRNG